MGQSKKLYQVTYLRIDAEGQKQNEIINVIALDFSEALKKSDEYIKSLGKRFDTQKVELIADIHVE